MKVDELLKELRLFSNNIITFNPPAKEKDIEKFEKDNKIILPKDYKEILLKHNGIELLGIGFNGIYYPSNAPNSITDLYQFEHWKAENPMPLFLIPFSPDGRGNHYCFDSRNCNSKSCLIVFWQHDHHYTSIDQPDVDNNSFYEWVEEIMINDTLEYYNYDGSEKYNKV